MLKQLVLLAFAALALLSSLACSSSVFPAPEGAGKTESAEPVCSAESGVQTAPPVSPSTARADDDAFYVVDFNDAYMTAGLQQILETDDSIYYLCSPSSDLSMIYFSDKEYKDWMPLCSKPECAHRGGDCNACIEGFTSNNMWLYGRHLYCFSVDRDNSRLSLWRMKLDGSEHEKLLSCSMEGLSTYKWFFHNKYAFLTFNTDVQETAEIKREFFCIDLGSSDPKPVKYDITDENGEPAELRMAVIGRGDKLYFLSNDGQNLVYCLDIPAAIMRTVCQLPADPGPLCTALYDDTLQFCLAWDLGEIITVDINTGELTVINEAEPQTMKWYRPYRRYIFGSNTANSLNPSLKGTAVYDYYGSIINDIPYESYNTEITISYILGDYVFGHNYYKDGARVMEETPQWYLDIRDIGTDNLMWRRWEPEG